MIKIALLLLVSFGLVGCETNQGTFTVMSNKIVKVDNFDLSKAERTKDVTGDEHADIIILFPTKTNPNLSGALNDAFKKTDGDVMTDVTVTSYSWYIPYIYGQKGWRVEGDVVKTRNNK